MPMSFRELHYSHSLAIRNEYYMPYRGTRAVKGHVQRWLRPLAAHDPKMDYWQRIPNNFHPRIVFTRNRYLFCVNLRGLVRLLHLHEKSVTYCFKKD